MNLSFLGAVRYLVDVGHKLGHFEATYGQKLKPKKSSFLRQKSNNHTPIDPLKDPYPVGENAALSADTPCFVVSVTWKGWTKLPQGFCPPRWSAVLWATAVLGPANAWLLGLRGCPQTHIGHLQQSTSCLNFPDHPVMLLLNVAKVRHMGRVRIFWEPVQKTNVCWLSCCIKRACSNTGIHRTHKEYGGLAPKNSAMRLPVTEA